jgi:hypothetical protein
MPNDNTQMPNENAQKYPYYYSTNQNAYAYENSNPEYQMYNYQVGNPNDPYSHGNYHSYYPDYFNQGYNGHYYDNQYCGQGYQTEIAHVPMNPASYYNWNSVDPCIPGSQISRSSLGFSNLSESLQQDTIKTVVSQPLAKNCFTVSAGTTTKKKKPKRSLRHITNNQQCSVYTLDDKKMPMGFDQVMSLIEDPTSQKDLPNTEDLAMVPSNFLVLPHSEAFSYYTTEGVKRDSNSSKVTQPSLLVRSSSTLTEPTHSIGKDLGKKIDGSQNLWPQSVRPPRLGHKSEQSIKFPVEICDDPKDDSLP